ncbi:hypothetical protein B0I35DRAFT_211254 [Stachybotrys elegans]|uniref:Uncharacterized protein n=1 Tax=Stachybotrys elegans TaxID=80388 RepID=A0A8K0SV56_9HYPO|nr:hypothetical protein B0I35DRAFT_211254 [Stachybotrys elegans]
MLGFLVMLAGVRATRPRSGRASCPPSPLLWFTCLSGNHTMSARSRGHGNLVKVLLVLVGVLAPVDGSELKHLEAAGAANAGGAALHRTSGSGHITAGSAAGGSLRVGGRSGRSQRQEGVELSLGLAGRHVEGVWRFVGLKSSDRQVGCFDMLRWSGCERCFVDGMREVRFLVMSEEEDGLFYAFWDKGRQTRRLGCGPRARHFLSRPPDCIRRMCRGVVVCASACVRVCVCVCVILHMRVPPPHITD